MRHFSRLRRLLRNGWLLLPLRHRHHHIRRPPPPRVQRGHHREERERTRGADAGDLREVPRLHRERRALRARRAARERRGRCGLVQRGLDAHGRHERVGARQQRIALLEMPRHVIHLGRVPRAAGRGAHDGPRARARCRRGKRAEIDGRRQREQPDAPAALRLVDALQERDHREHRARVGRGQHAHAALLARGDPRVKRAQHAAVARGDGAAVFGKFVARRDRAARDAPEARVVGEPRKRAGRRGVRTRIEEQRDDLDRRASSVVDAAGQHARHGKATRAQPPARHHRGMLEPRHRFAAGRVAERQHLELGALGGRDARRRVERRVSRSRSEDVDECVCHASPRCLVSSNRATSAA